MGRPSSLDTFWTTYVVWVVYRDLEPKCSQNNKFTGHQTVSQLPECAPNFKWCFSAVKTPK